MRACVERSLAGVQRRPARFGAQPLTLGCPLRLRSSGVRVA
jgi:hypothetical protein